MKNGGELKVRKLLEKTYENLAERNPHKEIRFEPALSKIADDSDWHRTKIGYMKYESANLFSFNGKNWAVARGERYGDYPAEPYDSDITALEPSEENPASSYIRSKLESSCYFRNSLIFGLADGNLAMGTNSSFFENPFEKKMKEILVPKLTDFVAQTPEYDTGAILTSTLQHPATKKMLYKPGFVDFLTETIEKILKEGGE
ncbi:MAG: hypothetical protein JSV92_03915 [archaeon]|nr:MAG: hypothetical protein JSV92_03915 [archaeon]